MQADPNGAHALLCEAGRHLLAAAEGGSAANVATALRALILATDNPDHRPAAPELVSNLRHAFELAMPVVTEDASDALPREHVAFSLGMACGLLNFLSRSIDDLRREGHRLADFDDKVDHAALLASQLEAIHRGRRIEARGLRARECLEMKLGLADAPPPEQLLH